jgi:hypothetical protein
MNHRVVYQDQWTDVQQTHWIIHHSFLVRLILIYFNTEIFIFLDVLEGNLTARTLCPSAQQYLSSHYNLHSMYGYFHAQATYKYRHVFFVLERRNV